MKKWKKIIPIVIIVILAAVLSVEVLRFVKNNPNKNPISVLVNDVGNNEASDEKTIDLHGTYSENDLLIKNEKIKVDGYNE